VEFSLDSDTQGTDCFEIMTVSLSGGDQYWYCPGIGIAKAWFDHFGSRYGYEETLLSFEPSE
jgi:hypothetical protein